MTNKLTLKTEIPIGIDRTLNTVFNSTSTYLDWNANLDLFLTELWSALSTFTFVDPDISIGEKVIISFTPESRPDSFYIARNLNIEDLVTAITIDKANLILTLHYLVSKGALPLGAYTVVITA